eukprot:365049-Chlamydomonas_euryale.AAC.7
MSCFLPFCPPPLPRSAPTSAHIARLAARFPSLLSPHTTLRHDEPSDGVPRGGAAGCRRRRCAVGGAGGGVRPPAARVGAGGSKQVGAASPVGRRASRRTVRRGAAAATADRISAGKQIRVKGSRRQVCADLLRKGR